jgi:hypothetical protein
MSDSYEHTILMRKPEFAYIDTDFFLLFFHRDAMQVIKPLNCGALSLRGEDTHTN